MSSSNPMAGVNFSALIVDDNWFNRDIFRIALESAGYTVLQAESGKEGIDMMKDQTFNVLVLDLQMPTVDGRAVLRNVREQELHRDMHIVVVTANAHMATTDVVDMADYIMYKPINVTEFSDFVRRLKSMSLTPPVN